MTARGARRLARGSVILCAALVFVPLLAQEPEVIIIDPNRPLIQSPGTVAAPAPSAPDAPSAGSSPPGAPLQEGVNAREVLADLWFKQRALLRRGEATEAARQVEAALDFMRREGLRGAPEIAGAFLKEARDRLSEGDYRRAQENFRLAASFDPALAAARVGLALALLRGDRDLRGASRELWAALKAGLGDAGSIYQQAGNGLLIAYLALCFGTAAALFLICLKSAPSFFHDLKERFPAVLTDESSHLAGWGILALPVLLLGPVVWLLTAWAALFYPYLRRVERLIALLALFILFGAGPVGCLLEWIAGTAVDPGARALIRSTGGGCDLQDEQALQRLAAGHPDEAMFPFLLASIHRIAGRFDEAMRMYRRVLEIDPHHARAMVNLANLHALRQEFAIAQNLYRKAGEADAALAIAHYNSHLAHLEVFHLESADQELKAARRIDDALVTELLAQGNEGRARRMPSDIGYAPKEIWRRAFTLRLDEGFRSAWARALKAPATLAGGAGLVLALLLPGLGIAPRAAPARRCRRCGRAFCRHCQVATKYPDHCSQCMHLFILRDGLAPNVKSRKMEEVVRHRRRVWIGERVLSLALPGGGHVMGGRPGLGALLLVVWFGAWLGLLLRGQLLVSSQGIAATGLLPAVAPGMAAMLAWLLGNLSSHESAQE
jgi:tetratricopeptide (TPR) repeat protein